MRSARFEHLLAGTAIALALALTPQGHSAFAQSDAPAAAAVPMPESADLPPPSLKDIAPADAKTDAPKSAAVKPDAPVTHASVAANPAVANPAAAKPAAATGETTASVPASESPAFTTASAADSALADRLREQLAAGKFDRILGGKKERAAVEAFYSGREFAPLWIADGAISERGKAAAAYLAASTPKVSIRANIRSPQIKAGMEPEALAEAEIKFTDAVLTFARHAMSGRMHYSRIAGDIQYDLARPDPANVLARVANAKDAGAALDGLNPPQPQYKALKAKLAEMRNALGRHRQADHPAAVRC